MSANRSSRRKRPAMLPIFLLILPALALCCILGALQTRSDDPPVVDYTLGPLSLHTAPGYVACSSASSAPCFTRWYIIRVGVLLPTRETWGFDIWAPFVGSQTHARHAHSTLAVWYHDRQLLTAGLIA